ncbi:GlxA family transcriptional regulator [Pseudoalteromonas fenneropenaei]|uniref:GlxA family transcriptional regulator n=1 Tax=Pseudoalteromonas fenneropenaei TaxID=1737459 RepID=A0ABV7CIX3_9GAMM
MTAVIPVYFVLTPEVLPLDLAGPLQAFLEAQKAGERLSFHYVGAASESNLGGGLMLAQLAPLPPSLPVNAIVVIPGCYGSAHRYQAEIGEVTAAWLRTVITKQAVLTVCSGALLAAKAGLLAHKYCTTHHELTARMQLQYPECKVLENRIFVKDGNMYTSAGISSGIDLTLFFIAEQFGEQRAMQVAREMLVYFRRSGHETQHSVWLNHRNHMHRAVHKVQDLVCQAVHKDFTVTELAQQVGISTRQLSRLFHDTLGITVQAYIHEIKMALARQLLTQSKHSIEQVAELCGFASSRHFRRIWQQFEPLSPLQFRQAFNLNKEQV